MSHQCGFCDKIFRCKGKYDDQNECVYIGYMRKLYYWWHPKLNSILCPRCYKRLNTRYFLLL